MAVEVAIGGLGPELFDRLHAVVAAHKADDALRPVTVVVAANSVGVAARRHLARCGDGIVGASFVTPYRLAELIGGASLAASGRRPVSTPVLAAAARQALRDVGTRFRAVADHPATELAVVRAFAELDPLDPDELDRLAGLGGRSRDVVALARAVRAIIAPSFHTERDLLDAATAVVARGGLAPELGLVVLFDPTRLARPTVRLLQTVGATGRLAVVAGLAGDDALDAPVVEVLAALDAGPVPAVAPCDRRVDRIVSVSDPDDEAREIVRRVVAAARAGIPLERMAIVFATREPYARLLHEHLDAAAIPHNGLAVRTLGDSVTGRALRTVLGLAERGYRRADVIGLAASTPVRLGRRPLRATAAERVSRRAGVIAGLDQWRARLPALVAAHPDRADLVDDAEALLELVEHLAGRIERAERARRWDAIAAIAHELLRTLLPGDRARAEWPVEEQRAHERVELALDRLATLDAIESAPTLERFRRALDAELDADLGRVGRIGEGVLVGPLSLVAGVATDAIFVAGLAEGGFPARHRDDSLLPDRDRAAVGTELLPDRRRRARAEQRALLAALALCRGERTLVHPRGDLRRTTDRPLSRYALDAVESISGRRPDAEELLHLDEDWFELVPSYAAGVAACTFPATAQDARIGRLLADRVDAATVAHHPVVRADDALTRGVELLLARASDQLTRFDGLVGPGRIPSVATEGRTTAATRLETYAQNPFAYFLGTVLGLREIERPEAIEQLTPLDKGSLYHEVLEAFLVEMLAAGTIPEPDAPWPPDAVTRLHAIGDAVAAAYEARGLTGRPLHWRRDRRRLHDDLDRWITTDDEQRRVRRSRPIAAELSFGRGDVPPVPMTLSDGRTLWFSGAADRVDATDDGGLWVTDYKTGKGRGYETLGVDDPDDGGRRLQLPIYAHAARTVFGRPDAPVTASYRFLGSEAGYREVEVPLVESVSARIDAVLGAIVDLIDSGRFPNLVGPPSSWGRIWPTLVDPDGRGGADQHRQLCAKLGDPRLAPWRPDEDDDGSGAADEPGGGR